MNKNTKSQVEYYVSKGESTLGPWSIEQIAEKLSSADIAATDFVYDDAKGDWIPLLECEALKTLLNRAKPKAPPPSRGQKPSEPLKSIPTAHTTEQLSPSSPMNGAPEVVAEWYVLKGANRYGPLTYLGVLRGLQEKTVYDFDFIWKDGMETWMRIADHGDFTPERIRTLVSQADRDESVFFARKYPRVSYDCEVIVNDERNAWLARTYEASPGGTGLIIENAMLMPGQILRLHFSSTNELPAFNALCEIVGKQFSKEARGKKAKVKYAVRFVQFFAGQGSDKENTNASSQAVEQRVQNYFKAA
jgi:hypothetical protein